MRLRLLGPLIVVLVTLLVVGLASELSYPRYSSSGTEGRLPSSNVASPLMLQATAPSWNPATSCKAVVLTMEQFVGSVPNPTQYTGSSPAIGSPVGADYSGGALTLEGAKSAGTNPPSSGWPYSKRAINPPCSVTLANGTVLPTLVEIHNLQVEGVGCDELNTVIPNICDWTFNVCNNLLAGNCSHTANYPDTLHKFHAEIDMNWTLYKHAPPVPTQGFQVDVQGFAFWDDAHVYDQYHSYSGWELHPLSAWRITNSTGKTVNMTASPSNIGPVGVGTTGNSIITATSINGFTGTISLSPLVPNSMGNVRTTSYVSASCSPSTITLTSGSRASSSCSFTASQPGSFNLIVLGSNSSRPTSSVTLQLGAVNTPDFTLSANPTRVTVNAGSSNTSTVTVSALNGFAGMVNLASNSTACTLTPGSVTGSGTSSLSCNFSRAGIFHVTIVGSSASLSHSATVTFTVQDFTINASSQTMEANTSATSTITVVALSAFAGNVTLTVVVPSGVGCGAISPQSVTGSGSASVSCSATVAGNYTLTVTGTSSSLMRMANATFIVQDFAISATPPPPADVNITSTSTINVAAVNHFDNPVSLTIAVPNGLSCGAMTPSSLTGSGAATLSCSATVAGNYTVTISAASTPLIHITTATFIFQDFTLTATTPAAVDAGQSTTASLAVTALNNFTGTVILSGNVPAGLECGTISPSTIAGSGTATLSCHSQTATSFDLIVSTTDGTNSHSTTVVFSFQDFTLNASPATVLVNQGTAASSNVTIIALNGFARLIGLSTNSTACTMTPTGVTSSGNSTLSCGFTQPGTYIVTVTGTSGTLSHTVQVVVTIESSSVGGVVIPVDKLRLSFQFLPASALILALVASGFTAVWSRKRRRREL